MNHITFQRGATLIEILVTVLILSVGLLGLASTQTMSLRNGNSAYQRYLASVAAYDILERMRANTAENYNGLSVTGTETAPAQKCESTCTSAQLKTLDTWQWAQLLSNSLPAVEGVAMGTANFDAATNLWTITITWSEQHTGANYGSVSGGVDQASFTLVTEL